MVSGIGSVLAFFVSTGVLPALVVGIVASGAIALLATRRGWTQRTPWVVFIAVLSVAMILVFTVFRESAVLGQLIAAGEELSMPGWSGLTQWSDDSWPRLLADPLGSTQILLNIALLVPAGFIWTLLTRRPVPVIAALAALSVGIEMLQAVTGLGVPDVADIAANAFGAVLGAAAATGVTWMADERAGRGADRRRWVLRATSSAGIVVGIVLVQHIGATMRQSALSAEANEVFAGTTVQDVIQWDENHELMERIWRGALSSDTDAFILDDTTARARFPAGVLGLQRCIIIVWRTDGFTVERAGGSECVGLEV